MAFYETFFPILQQAKAKKQLINEFIIKNKLAEKEYAREKELVDYKTSKQEELERSSAQVANNSKHWDNLTEESKKISMTLVPGIDPTSRTYMSDIAKVNDMLNKNYGKSLKFIQTSKDIAELEELYPKAEEGRQIKEAMNIPAGVVSPNFQGKLAKPSIERPTLSSQKIIGTPTMFGSSEENRAADDARYRAMQSSLSEYDAGAPVGALEGKDEYYKSAQIQASKQKAHDNMVYRVMSGDPSRWLASPESFKSSVDMLNASGKAAYGEEFTPISATDLLSNMNLTGLQQAQIDLLNKRAEDIDKQNYFRGVKARQESDLLYKGRLPLMGAQSQAAQAQANLSDYQRTEERPEKLNIARGNLAVAQGGLAVRQGQLALAKQRFSLAQEKQDFAEKTWNSKLASTGAMTDAQLNKAVMDYNDAINTYKESTEYLLDPNDPTVQAEIARLEADRDRFKSELDNRNINRKPTEIIQTKPTNKIPQPPARNTKQANEIAGYEARYNKLLKEYSSKDQQTIKDFVNKNTKKHGKLSALKLAIQKMEK